MSVAVAVAVLRAASGVTAIVGSGDDAKISPLKKARDILPPAVTVQRVITDPVNDLQGHSGLDSNRVQVDSWATTYAGAIALSDACRDAMQAAGHLCVGEFDNSDEETDPSQYRITQDYQVWV